MWTRLWPSTRLCHRTAISVWTPRRPRDRRGLLTLAIETSCDDTSVAVLETQQTSGNILDQSATLHFHKTVVCNSATYKGIHPIVALQSHQLSLGPLVQEAIQHLPPFGANDPLPSKSDILFASHDGQLRRKPDFIAVTRGPGMRSNLSVGLDTAKGLSLAWNIPMVGVHHMQAHALTPRLVSALANARPNPVQPDFPFLTLLVSGGHTLLMSSTSLTEHTISASTCDIALGGCLDKSARLILPESALKLPYGRALERFAFPDIEDESGYEYSAPRNRGEELEQRTSEWGWSFPVPLSKSHGGRSTRRMEYSFSGLYTAVQRALGSTTADGVPTRVIEEVSIEERRQLAREVQRVAFEHLAGRLIIYLKSLDRSEREKVKTLVVSGGVAANRFLGHVFRSMLDKQGFEGVEIIFPPIEYCTDNAAMIAWAGVEMWNSGWRTGLGVEPIRSWSLDPAADDGGILGAPGWTKVGG